MAWTAPRTWVSGDPAVGGSTPADVWNKQVRDNLLYLKGRTDFADTNAALKNNSGCTSSGGSVATNINALVTAIAPVTLTLLGARPVLVVWTGGAIANTSGVSQNIQQKLYVAGTAQETISIANSPTIAHGTTVELNPGSWLFPAGFAAGIKQFDIRFSVGDGSASIRFIPNSWNGSGDLSVIEF
jgi:hypothetical protein